MRSIYSKGDTVTAVCALSIRSALIPFGARGVVKDVAPHSTQVLVDFPTQQRTMWVRADLIKHTFATVEADNG